MCTLVYTANIKNSFSGLYSKRFRIESSNNKELIENLDRIFMKQYPRCYNEFTQGREQTV